MIRWFWNIIVGKPVDTLCSRECQWEIHDRSETMRPHVDGNVRPVAVVYTLRCKTCGDLKDHRSGL